MRMLLTGQVGLDRKAYLDQVEAIARSHGEPLKVFHVGDMMYREAGDVKPGLILDLPLSRLTGLRRAVFRDILADLPKYPNVIINSHATFRWKHGLFAAFDFDQLAQLQPDIFVTLLDNVETVHQRLLRDHHVDHGLKDLMVWREEEILATELMARANAEHPGIVFVLARGRRASTALSLFRLLLRPAMRKVYPSFPMSHVANMPVVLDEINGFRRKMAEQFITFDPGDVDEKMLYDAAVLAAEEGRQALDVDAGNGNVQLRVSDILSIGGDINGQIYARDFMMVRQSDMIVSYIPELSDGRPGLSSGVERELQHAYDHAREVYVIWRPKVDPSPFVTQTATRLFATVDEAMTYFSQRGFCLPHNLFEKL
ncbi:MAG: ATP-binding protein [Phycisphaerae bacterium]